MAPIPEMHDEPEPDATRLDELARALLIEEHSSIRAEILASYGYAQSIVKWTLATAAAILAAGLLAIYNAELKNNNLFVDNIPLAIFAIAIPGVIWLSAWTWLGELYRAERAGSFLRGLEIQIGNIPGLTERLGFQPLRWESFLGDGLRNGELWGKQRMTYLGTAGVFFGVDLGSLLLFGLLWFQLNGAHHLYPAEWAWAWWPVAAIVTLGGLVGCFAIYRRLEALGGVAAAVHETYPAIVTTPVAAATAGSEAAQDADI